MARINEIADEGQQPVITIYDLTTYKRRKILTVPFENSTATEFACVQFTYDSKYLVAITGEPDWYLYYYNWDKGKVESHAKAQNPSGQGIVESINITSCMWLTPDRIMFGTDEGVIMMVENGELRQNCVFRATEVMEMSLKKVETEGEESGDKVSTSSKQETNSENIAYVRDLSRD